MVEGLAAFLAVSAIVIVTPGQDTALTIRNSLLGGRGAGLATALGVSAGQAMWTLATSAGLAALRGRYRTHSGARSATPAVAFRQGVLSNLGNPKMAVFFSSLLPQFGGTSFASLLALGLVFCTLTLVWLTAYAVVVARAGDVLRRPRIRRALDAITGVVLTAFGIRLATERR